MTDQQIVELSPDEMCYQAYLNLALFRMIQKEIPSDEEGEENPALVERVLRSIRQEYRVRRRKEGLRSAAKTVGKVFMILIAALSIGFTSAFAVSNTFRKEIWKLFVVTTPDHSEIGVTRLSGEDSSMPTVSYQPTMFQPGWLPNDQFKQTELVSGSTMSFSTYKSDSGETMTLDVYSNSALVNLNTEGMTEKTVDLAGTEMHVFSKEDHYCVIWHGSSCYFVLQTYGLCEGEALAIAMSVHNKGDR